MFIDHSKTALNRQQHKKIVRIIHNLLNMNESVSFRKPVCYRALGLQDYKDVVKKPIDLNMVRRNNNEWVYKFVEEVFDDIQLCWDNCRIYNRPGSDIYQCAVKMEENFVEEILKQYPAFVIPPGIIKGRETFPEAYSTFVRVEGKEKGVGVGVEKQGNGQGGQEEIESGGGEKEEMEVEESPVFKKPSKKQFQRPMKPAQKVEPEMYEFQEEEEGEVGGSADPQSMKVEQVQPILITFPQYPSQPCLIALGQRIKQVKNQRNIIRGVLKIIQEDEEPHIQQKDETQFTFQASKLRFSTYVRISRFLDVATKM